MYFKQPKSVKLTDKLCNCGTCKDAIDTAMKAVAVIEAGGPENQCDVWHCTVTLIMYQLLVNRFGISQQMKAISAAEAVAKLHGKDEDEMINSAIKMAKEVTNAFEDVIADVSARIIEYNEAFVHEELLTKVFRIDQDGNSIKDNMRTH